MLSASDIYFKKDIEMPTEFNCYCISYDILNARSTSLLTLTTSWCKFKQRTPICNQSYLIFFESNFFWKLSAVREVIEKLEKREIDVLFVTPERLQTESFKNLVSKGMIPPVRIACIDEVHCLTEWSHNFRYPI